jgi:hypothetical protein
MCLGTDYYGSRVPPACAFELLDQFSGAGGTFLDTPNLYASWIPGSEGGESERVIGDWMAARRRRDRMFVGTKVGFPYQDSPGGLRASEIARECERSLRRLKSDSIDLYFTHRDDRTTPLPEILEAFTSLVKAGKVRFVGISNWYLWRLAEARLLAEVHHLASPAAVSTARLRAPTSAGACSSPSAPWTRSSAQVSKPSTLSCGCATIKVFTSTVSNFPVTATALPRRRASSADSRACSPTLHCKPLRMAVPEPEHPRAGTFARPATALRNSQWNHKPTRASSAPSLPKSTPATTFGLDIAVQAQGIVPPCGVEYAYHHVSGRRVRKFRRSTVKSALVERPKLASSSPRGTARRMTDCR